MAISKDLTWAESMATLYGGSASDYEDGTDSPSPTESAGSGGGWSGLFGGLLGAAGSAYSATVAADAASAHDNATLQAARLNATASSNSTASLMKMVPWLIGGSVVLLIGAFLLKRSRG